MKRILLAAALILSAPLCHSEPPQPSDLQLRTTIQLHLDIGIGASSMFNPRFFDGDIYANQINTPSFGRYPQGSSTPTLLVNNTFTPLEHRMVAPFRGANRTSYLLGGSGAVGPITTSFSRYDFNGENRMDVPVPGDGQSAAGFDWVDADTIIYTIYNPSGSRQRLALAQVVAEPFSVTPDTRWNNDGYVTTSVSTRIRNVRVGDVYSGHAYYGDAGQNSDPGFYAINLATGEETLLGNAGTLTGGGSFGLWTVVERGGYLYVQTTDNGIQVYSMTSATSLGGLHTTYPKELLTDLTGYGAQFWGFDVTADGRLVLGGTGVVFELSGPERHLSYRLEPAWTINPLEPHEWVTINHLHRGLAYNPVTGNLLTVSRFPAAGSGEVYVINSSDGTHTGNLSTNGIKYDKNFPINMIGVAADGVIYACSLAVDSASVPNVPINNNGPFRIYRWADENADPELVYEGDPSDNDETANNRRFGDNFAVRGAGISTEILAGSRAGNVLAHFTTSDGVNFTHLKIFAPDMITASLNGIAWGSGNTFYTKADNAGGGRSGLLHFSLDPGWATLLKADLNIRAFGGIIAYDPDRDLLAIIRTLAADAVHRLTLFKGSFAGLFQQDHPEAFRPFPTANPNGNGTGAIAFGGGRLFALASNNGILAFDIVEEDVVVDPQIFWTETGGFVADSGSVWSSAFDGSGKKPIAAGLNRPIGIALDEANGHLYWAEDGIGGQTPSRIVRANLDGSEQEVLFSEYEDGFTNAQMIELDLANGHVYWTDFVQGIIRGNLDGTGYTVMGGLGLRYTALALDLVNGHIYYGDPTENGVLFRRDLAVQNDAELVRDLAGANFRFNSIAVDAANNSIYYTDTGTHEIKRMNLDGSNQTLLLTDAGLAPLGIALRPDGTLFWVGTGQRLGTAKVDGVSGVNLRVGGSGITPFGIAVSSAVPAGDIQITGISLADSTITITWQGGQEPFQLQRRADVAGGQWENVGEATSATQATDTLSGQQMFYRIQGN